MTSGALPTETVARAVAVSTFSQVAAKVVHLGLNVVVSLALIRYLGPAGYGDYVFVFSFAAVIGLASDLGLSRVAVREMASREEDLPAVLGTSIATRLGLAVLTWAAAQVILLALGARPSVRMAVAVASLLYLSQALASVVILFQVRLALQYEALVDLAAQILDTALVLWLIAAHAVLLALIAAPVASSLLAVALALGLARLRFRARFRFDRAWVRRLLVEALPVGLSLLVSVAYLKLDSVLLGLLRPHWEVGVYGAAYKPVEYLLLAAAVPINTLFPLLSRWWRVDPARFQVVYQRGTEALVAYALPFPILLALTAGPMVAVVYALSFAPSALPLALLAVSMVFMVFSAWQSFVLLVGGLQRVALAYNLASLAVNAVLNVVLILRFGFLGATAAAVASSIFMAALSVAAPGRLMGVWPDPRRLLRVLAAGALLAASVALLLWLGLPWPAALAAAAVLYPAWLLACRVATPAELRIFLPARVQDAAGAVGAG